MEPLLQKVTHSLYCEWSMPMFMSKIIILSEAIMVGSLWKIFLDSYYQKGLLKTYQWREMLIDNGHWLDKLVVYVTYLRNGTLFFNFWHY